MHSYEHRVSNRRPWQQLDRDQALDMLGHYGAEAETILKRVDAGETITSTAGQLRKFDPSTAPFANRPLPGQNEHGDYIYA